jgi:hypothetical protein
MKLAELLGMKEGRPKTQNERALKKQQTIYKDFLQSCI